MDERSTSLELALCLKEISKDLGDLDKLVIWVGGHGSSDGAILGDVPDVYLRADSVGLNLLLSEKVITDLLDKSNHGHRKELVALDYCNSGADRTGKEEEQEQEIYSERRNRTVVVPMIRANNVHSRTFLSFASFAKHNKSGSYLLNALDKLLELRFRQGGTEYLPVQFMIELEAKLKEDLRPLTLLVTPVPVANSFAFMKNCRESDALRQDALAPMVPIAVYPPAIISSLTKSPKIRADTEAFIQKSRNSSRPPLAISPNEAWTQGSTRIMWECATVPDECCLYYKRLSSRADLIPYLAWLSPLEFYFWSLDLSNEGVEMLFLASATTGDLACTRKKPYEYQK